MKECNHFDEKLLTQPENETEFIIASILSDKTNFPDETDRKNWGDSHFMAAVSLHPAKENRSVFRSLVFPESFRRFRTLEGHWYAKRRRCRSSRCVSESERETILPAAEDFSSFIKNTSVPHELADAVGSFEHTDQMLLVDETGRVRHVGGLRQLRLPHDRYHLPGFVWYSGIVPELRKNRWKWAQNSSVRTDACTISLHRTYPLWTTATTAWT